MPHRPWRLLARDVAKYLRRGWASGFQPIPRLQIRTIVGIVRWSLPRLHPRAVGRYVDEGVACAMVVPQTTMGAPDGEHAIAEVVGIPDRGIRSVVRHYSSLTTCRSSVVAGCLMAPRSQAAFPPQRGHAGRYPPPTGRVRWKGPQRVRAPLPSRYPCPGLNCVSFPDMAFHH